MGILDLRKALRRTVPETVQISIKNRGDTSVYVIGDKEIVAPSVKPVEEIAADYMRDMNPFEEKQRVSSMSITGLKSGAFHGTIEALRQRLIDKQNQGAAKIAAAGELGAAKIDEAVNSAEAKIDKEVSEVLQDFSEFTNGGPA
jgi:hypothetical protein